MIYEMSQQKHISTFLNPKSLKQFQNEFLNDNNVYLNVLNLKGILVGYVILVIDENSVQLKRIVIAENYLGIGQKVLREVEQYCVEKFDLNTLWLDVYANNDRAIKAYENAGYVRYDSGVEKGKEVLFYRKKYG